jgi:hypothetical protein
MDIYCMKCKQKNEAENIENVTLKNGMPAVKGTCVVCGTKVSVIAKKTA